MSSHETPDTSEARRTLLALSEAVREMNALGAKPIPANPRNFNMLARSYSDVCRICNLPGHRSANIRGNADGCRTAVRSLLGFWDDQAQNIKVLYSTSSRFNDAVHKIVPTYEMRLDSNSRLGGSMEEVIVDRMTRNYLKFQAWFSRVQAKLRAVMDMDGADGQLYEDISSLLNSLLLDGESLSSLFAKSVDAQAKNENMQSAAT